MKYILPLLITTLIFSCSGPSETSHDPITDNSTEKTDTIDKGQYVKNMTVDEFLKLPFTLSVMSDEKWVTNQNYHPSRQDENITDTLITLSFKQSIIHIHNHDLVDGHITDPEIKLVKDIHVGMTKDAFLKSFSDIKNHQDAPFVKVGDDNIRLGCCAEQNDIWTFTFDADTIVSIDYSSYLD